MCTQMGQGRGVHGGHGETVGNLSKPQQQTPTPPANHQQQLPTLKKSVARRLFHAADTTPAKKAPARERFQTTGTQCQGANF